MANAIVLFVGGPADLQRHAIPEPVPPEYRVPVARPFAGAQQRLDAAEVAFTIAIYRVYSLPNPDPYGGRVYVAVFEREQSP